MAYTRHDFFRYAPEPQASQAKALKAKIIKHVLATRSDEIVGELEFTPLKKAKLLVVDLVQVHEESEMGCGYNEVLATGQSEVGALEALEDLARACGCASDDRQG
ncbi:hypothetical protein E8E12_006423 [Didymella heteroderae]|uniref:Uncharacterized protein n=1 Tax=Didymella heteroderae TaxID=1769908 RepID=A0A9P4WUF5_9PLEO|nr:hypothetical protein E8E12_006423 [Didymella heteroderae]